MIRLPLYTSRPFAGAVWSAAVTRIHIPSTESLELGFRALLTDDMQDVRFERVAADRML
jgi:hypothetical protein